MHMCPGRDGLLVFVRANYVKNSLEIRGRYCRFHPFHLYAGTP